MHVYVHTCYDINKFNFFLYVHIEKKKKKSGDDDPVKKVKCVEFLELELVRLQTTGRQRTHAKFDTLVYGLMRSKKRYARVRLLACWRVSARFNAVLDR